MGENKDESNVVCDIVSQIKFKTSMLRSKLYDYSDTYISVTGTITVVVTIIRSSICWLQKWNKQYTNR